MNFKVKYDVIIIGNGIASKVFQFHFLKSNPNKKILVLESPLYPSCSIKTTSHVGLVDPVKGVSPLGDLIVDSYDSFKEFVKNYEPKGVEKGLSFHDEMTNGSEHFFINSIFFLEWLDLKNARPNRE
ncbi:MAG: hypothetical protein KC493_15085, partial [Bacteriovoracaceae bacterium]|nr:hypothetical protein [Bacteriovoracaceae bacterium]